MPDAEDNSRAYVQQVLEHYRATPGVLGRVRRADHELAAQLHARRVPFYVVANAFIVAAARRQRHNAFATPLPPIRSLHYFLPVIRELTERPLGPRDIDKLRRQLHIGEPPR